MTIENCITEDVESIYNLYEEARILQTEKQMVVWPYFDKKFIEKEVLNKQQWKLLVDKEIACNWAITFTDKEIWEDKEKGDAIYIHRIVTNPKYRGNNFVKAIVDWARPYALEKEKKFIRLDTLGNNTKLIQHYTNSGFAFLGMVKLTNTGTLPLHYQKEPNCCLFEIELK